MPVMAMHFFRNSLDVVAISNSNDCKIEGAVPLTEVTVVCSPRRCLRSACNFGVVFNAPSRRGAARFHVSPLQTQRAFAR